jgi:hypothetical protein
MAEERDDDSQLELSSRAAGEARYVSLGNGQGPSVVECTSTIVEGEADVLRNPVLEEVSNNESEASAFSQYSQVSNFCFFVGSILYVWTSTISVIDAYRYYDDYEGDDDGDGTDDDETESEPFWTAYKLLASAAAAAYLANSLIDGRVALGEVQGKVGRSRFGDDPRWEIGVAVTFGVAALCDFLSELIWNDDDQWPGYAAGCAAVDIYLLNAVLVLLGRRPRFRSLPETLMSAGDILFLVGSVIDVTIAFVDNPNAPSSRTIEIAWCSFSSSALWFIDSLLYILADFVSDNDDDYSSVDSDDSEELQEEELEIASTIDPASPESVSIDDDDDKGTHLHHRVPLKSATLE